MTRRRLLLFGMTLALAIAMFVGVLLLENARLGQEDYLRMHGKLPPSIFRWLRF